MRRGQSKSCRHCNWLKQRLAHGKQNKCRFIPNISWNGNMVSKICITKKIANWENKQEEMSGR